MEYCLGKTLEPDSQTLS